MSVETLHRPTHRDALVALEAAVERGDLLTLFGRCTVEYEGRAESVLGPGDRLVVLKPDGTALVHTDEQRTPVNWQPPGAEHHASVRDGRLRIRSVRTTPDERLDVHFERVDQLSAFGIDSRSDLSLVGSEEDLRQRILDEPTLVGSDFEPLATERETTAGPVDVFGRDGAGRPVVVELKRRRVGPSAVRQLRGYVDAVEREEGDGVDVVGVLVAPSVTDRAAALLDDAGMRHVAVGPDGAVDDEGTTQTALTDAASDIDGADDNDTGPDGGTDADTPDTNADADEPS